MTSRDDAFPIELGPCDIERFREGKIPFATTFESARAGPHVMVNAVTHGNEICGAHALTALFELKPRPHAGKLTFSFANVGAYGAFDPDHPFRSRYLDEDFNRLWSAETLDSERTSRELARAREMRPLIDTVDHLLDIHSTDFACAPMLLAGAREKGRTLAEAIGYPEYVVCDPGHAAGKRLRDYAAFNDPASPKSALLVECGQHFSQAAVAVALETALRFLIHFGALEPARAQPHLSPTPEQTVIEVSEAITIQGDDFRFTQPFVGFEEIPKAGTVIAHDGERPIETPYDDCVLVMPARFPSPGTTAVRLGRRVA
ncbi:MAG: succinylglutamate desuccinylase/aspartoacylase family protein [Alphaproteobacteria bacterium]